MAKNNDYGTIDKMLLYVTLVLLAIGLVMVFSASSYDAMISYKDAMFFFKRQLVWAAKFFDIFFGYFIARIVMAYFITITSYFFLQNPHFRLYSEIFTVALNFANARLSARETCICVRFNSSPTFFCVHSAK